MTVSNSAPLSGAQPQISQQPPHPAAAAPQVGDLVQIAQHVWLPDGTIARPPVAPGRHTHWIYGIVRAVGDVFRVQVRHPGNRQHGQELDVPPAQLRTVADVQQLAARAATPEEKRHYQAQADRLAGKPRNAKKR